MGFLSRLFSASLTPARSIDEVENTVRTAPIVRSPRYFTKPEADALHQLAGQKATESRQSVRAYKHLERIEESDARVHRAHRRYQSGVASHDLSKKRADIRHQRKLESLRPNHAQLEAGLEKSTANADRRIAELRKLMGA